MSLVQCVVLEDYKRETVIQPLDEQCNFVAYREDLGRLRLRRGQPVLARLERKKRGTYDGEALDVKIDEARLPDEDQIGRIVHYNQNGNFGHINDEVNNWSIWFYINSTQDNALYNELEFEGKKGQDVSYGIGLGPNGLEALDILQLHPDYSGRIIRIGRNLMFAFLKVDGFETEEPEITKKDDVFLHTKEVKGRLRIGQRYSFNVRKTEKGWRAFNAELIKPDN